jgi:hypothetical protein
MSGAPPDFPNMVSATPTASSTPLEKRRGCGWLGPVGGAIVLVLTVMIFLSPWALDARAHLARRRKIAVQPRRQLRIIYGSDARF